MAIKYELYFSMCSSTYACTHVGCYCPCNVGHLLQVGCYCPCDVSHLLHVECYCPCDVSHLLHLCANHVISIASILTILAY